VLWRNNWLSACRELPVAASCVVFVLTLDALLLPAVVSTACNAAVVASLCRGATASASTAAFSAALVVLVVSVALAATKVTALIAIQAVRGVNEARRLLRHFSGEPWARPDDQWLAFSTSIRPLPTKVLWINSRSDGSSELLPV